MEEREHFLAGFDYDLDMTEAGDMGRISCVLGDTTTGGIETP